MIPTPDLSKRTFLKLGGAAAVSALALGTTACGPSMSVWVQTITGALEELKPLLPAQAALLSKAISIAKSFNQAWQDEKFSNAVTILENLTATIQQIIDAAGVNLSQQVKTMIAVVGIALRTVAVLLKEQMNDPAVATTVNDRAMANPSASRQRTLIERLADPAAVDAAFAAAKP